MVSQTKKKSEKIPVSTEEVLSILKRHGSYEDIDDFYDVEIISLMDKIHESSKNAPIPALRDELGEIDIRIRKLFEFAKDEEFENGMETVFSKELISIIEEYGNDAVETIAPIFIQEKENVEVLSEALRWLGRMEHSSTSSQRLWLLERCMLCSSPQLRDGAALGIASMDDSRAIPFLKSAIQHEKYNELREDMEQVLLQLEDTANAIHLKKN